MAPKYILEQFLQQELLINITEHEVRVRGSGGMRLETHPAAPHLLRNSRRLGGPSVERR